MTAHAEDVPRVSVAVSTRDRRPLLEKLIAALESQTLGRDNFEVVILDDGSKDDTSKMLKAIEARGTIVVRTLRIPRSRGQAGGRNIAWRASRAPIVAFTDDDCIPTPDWLERGLDALGPDDILVGRTVPDPTLRQGPFSRTIIREDSNWLPTCNIFYWRSDLEAVGGFDEAFGRLGCEDTDLGLRVHKSLDRRLAYDADVLVYHDVRASKFLDALRETQRWRSVAKFFRAHPEARSWLFSGIYWHPSHPRVLVAALGLALTPIYPPAILLGIPWVWMRTKTRRVPGRLRQVYPALPGTFVIDLAESVALLRGAVRYRTLVI